MEARNDPSPPSSRALSVVRQPPENALVPVSSRRAFLATQMQWLQMLICIAHILSVQYEGEHIQPPQASNSAAVIGETHGNVFLLLEMYRRFAPDSLRTALQAGRGTDIRFVHGHDVTPFEVYSLDFDGALAPVQPAHPIILIGDILTDRYPDYRNAAQARPTVLRAPLPSLDDGENARRLERAGIYGSSARSIYLPPQSVHHD